MSIDKQRRAPNLSLAELGIRGAGNLDHIAGEARLNVYALALLFIR